VTVTPVLEKVLVTPADVELLPGVTAAFSAKGRMTDDNLTNISVAWSATGGTISGSGVYTAGSAPGTYRVIGRVAGGSLADTSRVTISQPVATLVSLTLTPGTGTVPVGGVVDFATSATWTNGSTALPVLSWTSQAGSVDPEGRWTAPATAGTYRIIARHASGTVADTAVFNVIVSAPTVSALTVSPKSPGVQGGQTVNFVATASWTDGSSAPTSVTWSATGGTIDAGGRWVAPNLSGVFRVVARAAGANVADTAVVTVAESPEGAEAGVEMRVRMRQELERIAATLERHAGVVGRGDPSDPSAQTTDVRFEAGLPL
jgi:hypothetical protein